MNIPTPFPSEDQILGQFRSAVLNGGPSSVAGDLMESLRDWHQQSNVDRRRMLEFADRVRETLGEAMDPSTIQGQAFTKARGYAGDFELIEAIYAQRVSANPSLSVWDRFIHLAPATTAVRNRLAYFGQLLDELIARKSAARVLELGSGSGRAIAQWLAHRPDAPLAYEGVDVDCDAVAFASGLNARHHDRVRFHHKNVFGFRPRGQFDLIWSAGLFDYFDDRVFVRVVARLLPHLAPGGSLAIGNFGPDNPTRPWMELVCDWWLHHRSPEALRALMMEAGASADGIEVRQEGAGVNLFVHSTAAST